MQAIKDQDRKFESLLAGAEEVLRTSQPKAKAEACQALAEDWARGGLPLGKASPPSRPARPVEPRLGPPRDVPRRKINRNIAGRIALLHALAHIELNAIDLACDILARFGGDKLPLAFHEDWLKVAREEAFHFTLLSQRLEELGSHYGALTAHDGLWQAAEETAGDLLARLAVVPLVLEARGLDVTPAMIEKLRAAEDDTSADLLEIIYRDEIGHVAIGKRWFDEIALARKLEPKSAWQDQVRKHFRGQLKPPFNETGRAQADFPWDYYGPLAEASEDC